MKRKNKMIRMLFVMIIATLAMAQDDFFQPGYTIGGYGELHYNRAQNGNDDATIKLDFHRFIIYYGYNWT